MGTEYVLGVHDNVDTVNGHGVFLSAYEMSGLFSVQIDLPKDRVDIDAWDSCARVELWNDVTPEELLRIGKNIVNIANFHIQGFVEIPYNSK